MILKYYAVLLRTVYQLGVTVNTFSSGTREAEAEESLDSSLVYRVRFRTARATQINSAKKGGGREEEEGKNLPFPV